MVEQRPGVGAEYGTTPDRTTEQRDPKVEAMLGRYVGDSAAREVLLSTDPATDERRAELMSGMTKDWKGLRNAALRADLARTLVRGQVQPGILPYGETSRDAARALLRNLPLDKDTRDVAAATYTQAVASLGDDPDIETLHALEATGEITAGLYPTRTKTISDVERDFASSLFRVVQITGERHENPVEMPNFEGLEAGSTRVPPPPEITEDQQAAIDRYQEALRAERLASASGEFTLEPGQPRPSTPALHEAIIALYEGRSRTQITEALGLGSGRGAARDNVGTHINRLIESGDLQPRADVVSQYQDEVAKRRDVVTRLTERGVRPATIVEVTGIPLNNVYADRDLILKERREAEQREQQQPGGETSPLATGEVTVHARSEKAPGATMAESTVSEAGTPAQSDEDVVSRYFIEDEPSTEHADPIEIFNRYGLEQDQPSIADQPAPPQRPTAPEIEE